MNMCVTEIEWRSIHFFLTLGLWDDKLQLSQGCSLSEKKTSQGVIEAATKKINYAFPSGYIALIDSVRREERAKKT